MPFPNEHAARQAEPSDFVKFRTVTKGFPEGVRAIVGFRDDGSTEVQSIRFAKALWSEEEAKDWLKENGFSVTAFEPASDEPSDKKAKVVIRPEPPSSVGEIDAPVDEPTYVKDFDGKRYPDGASVDPRLPSTYRSEFGEGVPEGANCGSCEYWVGGVAFCNRWFGTVRAGMYCDAYEPAFAESESEEYGEGLCGCEPERLTEDDFRTLSEDGSLSFQKLRRATLEAVSFNAGAREEMFSSMGVYRQEVGSLVGNVGTGKLGVSAAVEQGQELLERRFEEAYRQGLKSMGVTRFGDFDRSFIQASVKSEMRFLGTFVDDVATGSGVLPYGTRAGYYSRGYESMYLAGQVQALPWETDIYWKLGGGEHCKDCVSLSASGPYSKATLPLVPGGGGTQCLFNCGCYFEYKERPARDSGLDTVEGTQLRVDQFTSQLPEGMRLASVPNELDVIRGYWGQIAEHRTAVRYAPTEMKAAHVAARRDANAALIDFLEAGGSKGGDPIYWTRGMEDTLFNPPPGGGVGGGFPATGRTGIASSGSVITGGPGVPAAGKKLSNEPIPGLGEPE